MRNRSRLHTHAPCASNVPPIGFPAPLPTFIDRDLLQYDLVWAAAGTPRHVFPVAPQELLRITGGTAVDLKLSA